MRPLSLPSGQSKLERLLSQLIAFLLLVCGVLLSCFGYVAIALLLVEPATLRPLALALDIAGFIAIANCVAIVLLYLTSQLIGVANMLFNADEPRFAILEYSLLQAAELTRFNDADLKAAEKSLETEIDATQARMGFFLGGKDKVAVVAILCAGWVFYSQFPHENPIWNNPFFYLGVALVGGFLLGGFFVHRKLVHIQYQKGIVSLAISSSEVLAKLPRHCSQPSPSRRRVLEAECRRFFRLATSLFTNHRRLLRPGHGSSPVSSA